MCRPKAAPRKRKKMAKSGRSMVESAVSAAAQHHHCFPDLEVQPGEAHKRAVHSAAGSPNLRREAGRLLDNGKRTALPQFGRNCGTNRALRGEGPWQRFAFRDQSLRMERIGAHPWKM
jgi:hypothetical protein